MRNEYIPVATVDTVYYKPQTEKEMESMTAMMKVGDMIYAKYLCLISHRPIWNFYGGDKKRL